MNRTRIVCTIGPRTLSEDMLRHLHGAGMMIARLNGSHADLTWHRNAISEIRRVLPGLPILLDIPGRKIRTMQLALEPRFNAGDIIVLTSDAADGNTGKVPVNYPNLHADLKPGNIILADDGTLKFTVLSIEGRDIHCRADTAGQLKSRKGINVPFVTLNTPQVTPRDEQMIAFARETGVDFIGLSFVESPGHVEAFRKLIGGSTPRIIAKVENQGGMNNVDSIAAVADGIMIDRGDLSVETSLHDVAIRQKKVISSARRYGKPVIVATEMLHTMIENPFPTKAEVSDITNAVLDGCAATMLSGETAVGAFPVETVTLMRQVTDAAEDFAQTQIDATTLPLGETVPQAIAQVIPALSRCLPITKIVAITRSGFAARMIAAHRPQQPILAVSDDAAAARSFNLIPGTTGIFSATPFPKTSIDHIGQVLHMLWQQRHLADEDMVIVTGVTYPHTASRMNTVQVHRVAELQALLGWRRPT